MVNLISHFLLNKCENESNKINAVGISYYLIYSNINFEYNFIYLATYKQNQ